MAEKSIKSLNEVAELITALNTAFDKANPGFTVFAQGTKTFSELGITLHYGASGCNGCSGCSGTCSGACSGCTGCSGCSNFSSGKMSSTPDEALASLPADFANELAKKVAQALQSSTAK